MYCCNILKKKIRFVIKIAEKRFEIFFITNNGCDNIIKLMLVSKTGKIKDKANGKK